MSATSGRPPPTRDSYHHGDLRAAALAAALAIVERHGQGALALRALAAELGVNHRALYRHFPSKESLVAAVAREGFRQLADDLAGAREPRPFLRRFTGFVVQRARLYEVMTGAGARPAITPRAPGSPTGHVIAHSLRALARDRSGDAARDTVFRVWGVVHGLAMLYAAGLLRARSPQAAITYIADAAHETLGASR